MPLLFINILVTCRGQNSAEKLEGVEESSVQAPACLSLVNNRWSAILHPVSKSSLVRDESVTSKNSMEPIEGRMVSVANKTCGSVYFFLFYRSSLLLWEWDQHNG